VRLIEVSRQVSRGVDEEGENEPRKVMAARVRKRRNKSTDLRSARLVSFRELVMERKAMEASMPRRGRGRRFQVVPAPMVGAEVEAEVEVDRGGEEEGVLRTMSHRKTSRRGSW